MAISRLNISLTQRLSAHGGSVDVDILNDSFTELSFDLAEIADQWNKQLIPLFSTLPIGVLDSAVNAFTQGLDARTIWADASADTTSTKLRFYNLARSRPKTIKEVLENIYSLLDNLDIQIDQTVFSGGDGLTEAQKQRIGINIFDSSQTSVSTSLDGLTASNLLNLIQLAKDLYGATLSPTWSLDNDGVANLPNSVAVIVNALLTLHGGSWASDLTLDHSGIPELTAIHTYVGMESASDVIPNYSSNVFIIDGDNLTTAIGKLDSAIGGNQNNFASSYGALRASSSIPSGNWVMVGGRVIANDGGEGSFIWDENDVRADDDGSILKVTAITTGRWVRVIDDNTYNNKWFGAVGDGVTDDSAENEIVFDAATALDNKVTSIRTQWQTTSNTEDNIAVVPIGSGTNRIFRADATILAAVNGDEFSSHKITGTFSTTGVSTSIIAHDEQYSPTASGWWAHMEYENYDLNVIVSGKSATTINWYLDMELRGINY